MALSSTERSRKFRQKKLLKDQEIHLSADEAKKKIFGAQKSYLWTSKNKEIDWHPESPIMFYFLVEARDKSGCYIFRRVFKEGSSKSSMEPMSPRLMKREDAEIEFQEIKSKQSKRWKTIDHYLEKAAIFHAKSRNIPESVFSNFPTNQFSFLMALDEILTNGYKVTIDDVEYYEKGTKSSSTSRVESLQRVRRYLMHLFANPTLPDFPDTLKWEMTFRKMFTEIVYDSNEDNEISDKTYIEKGSLIISLAETISRFSSVLGKDVLVLPQIARTEYDEIRKIYTNNEVEDEPSIIPSKSFERIDIDQLELLLNYLWNQSKDDYHSAILGLSTLLRPTELKRVVDNPELYLKDKHFLNYSGGKLITKTLKKTDISRLPNPSLEIVARIILLKIKPTFTPTNFNKKNPEGFRNEEQFKDCFFRRFRTTGAVMVKYTSSDSDAQTRMGHTTNQMLHKTYAPLVPSIKNPEQYLNIKHDNFSIMISNKKESISKQCKLWDLWLLKNFMKHHLSEISDPKEQEEFKKMCIEEALTYDRIKNGDSSSIEETVL